MNDINIYEKAAALGQSINSRYADNRAGRGDLLNFFDANGWLEMRPSPLETAITATAEEYAQIEPALLLWLKAYKQPGDVKISLMLERYGGIYPAACEIYRSFIAGRDVNSSHMYWQLLDFLLAELARDISEYSEHEIEALAQAANETLPLKTARLFSEYLSAAKIGGAPLTQWVYIFEPREHPGLNKDAYALDDYAIMAYCVFSEEAWHDRDMVAKAVGRKAFADLWLFTALHLICALRYGDIGRMPAPRLPYGADSVRAELLSGAFPARRAAALCDEMVSRFNLMSMKPSKTRSQPNVAELKLSVPESLRAPLGTIIAAVLTHSPECLGGQAFVRPDNSLHNARTFFGEDYAEALGKRRFSSRRANKAYLQGIDLTANAKAAPGKPKGYMLAALARSHKGGIGTLPRATDIYLKDANFAGYTPEFIAREMFERGVFGFIPATLLEMYAGEKYKALPVGAQTKLIVALGLSGGQIEHAAGAVEMSLSRSRRVVSEIFAGDGGGRENVFRVLQNIASGSAPGKQGGHLCLMAAATGRCPHGDRSGCAGCEYEILTKAAMHTLVREYARLSALRDASDNAQDKQRYGKLLETAVYPAVDEFIESAKMLYPDAAKNILLDIFDEGMDYVDYSEREAVGAAFPRIATNAT